MRLVGARVELEEGDLPRFRLIVERFGRPEPWPPGRWRALDPATLWLELVAQLLVVGGRRPVERMRASGAFRALALDALLPRALSDPDAASREVHAVLARHGVRYASPEATEPSQKARWIVAAALSPALVRDGGFALPTLLAERLPEAPAWGEANRERERGARRLLVRLVPGFGPKSASDFLNHVGAALNLLAFDSRIQGLLRDGFGLTAGELRRLVGTLERYEALERPFVEEACPALGIPPAVLDELLFGNAAAAERLLAPVAPSGGG